MTLKDKIENKIFHKSLDVIEEKFFEYGDLLKNNFGRISDDINEVLSKLKEDKVGDFFQRIYDRLRLKREDKTTETKIKI